MCSYPKYTNDSLELVIENLMLQGRNLFPSIIGMEAHNFIKFPLYDSMTLNFHQIQVDMKIFTIVRRRAT